MTTLRGRLLTGQIDLPCAEIVVEGDCVLSVEPVPGGTSEVVILPGLIDLHCHGGGGASFTTGSLDDARAAAEHHLRQGTTTLVGSAVTDAPDRMLAVVDALADAVDEGVLAAIHVEGPFLDASRCGAQDPTYLREPDLTLAGRILDAGRGHVRVMTLAPELPGADELGALLVAHGVRAAVGHTAATAAVTRDFLRRPGHDLVTHLFNGMSPLHHRDAGPVAGCLAAAGEGRASVELIADGVHLDDEVVATVFALLGPDRVILVTDAMPAAGMPDGDYVIGPRRVVVADGVARLADGSSLAGGTARLMDVVRRQIAAGIPSSSVMRAATLTPAAVLGFDPPGLEPGHRADLVVTDAELAVQRVMRAGVWIR